MGTISRFGLNNYLLWPVQMIPNADRSGFQIVRGLTETQPEGSAPLYNGLLLINPSEVLAKPKNIQIDYLLNNASVETLGSFAPRSSHWLGWNFGDLIWQLATSVRHSNGYFLRSILEKHNYIESSLVIANELQLVDQQKINYISEIIKYFESDFHFDGKELIIWQHNSHATPEYSPTRSNISPGLRPPIRNLLPKKRKFSSNTINKIIDDKLYVAHRENSRNSSPFRAISHISVSADRGQILNVEAGRVQLNEPIAVSKYIKLLAELNTGIHMATASPPLFPKYSKPTLPNLPNSENPGASFVTSSDPHVSLNNVVIDVNSLAGINITGTRDDTSIINNAINSIPNGTTINLFFGGGTYEIDGTIILPSNTNVIGNNSTIVANSGSQIANTLSQFSNQQFNGTGETLNTDISVRGLTFVYPVPIWDIAIWFQNVSNVDISNNTFLAASNGDIGVLNGTNVVISNNVAVGNINGAYNGWNGLQNVAVTNNSDYQSGSAAGSGGYWFNGTYNPGAINQGSQSNSYIVNNINAGVLPGGTAFGIGTLNYGYTILSNANMQGNLFAVNSTPSTFGFLDNGPGLNNAIQANIVSQYVSGNPEQTTPFDSSGSGLGTQAAVGNAILGNEVFGSTNSLPNFRNIGDASTTANDVVLLAQNLLEFGALVGVEDLNALQPVVSGVGGSAGLGTLNNGPLPLGITVSGPDNLILTPSFSATVPNVLISDTSMLGNEIISLQISDIFGTLSIDGQTGSTVNISGSVQLINSELRTLSYAPNSNSWNDDIHFLASDSSGNRAVWDIPVDFTDASAFGGQGIGTFSSANSTNPPVTILIPVNGIPLPPPLGGDTLVVQGGGHIVTMGGSIAMVFTGAGSNSVIGGADPGYIQTNNGPTHITLSQGGDITVSGGVGGISVAANSGNDLIQSASGPIQVNLGSGADTVLAGIGPATVNGGSGAALVTSLPQFAGPLDVTLGFGGGVVYALSGEATITTASGGWDTVFGGQGAVNVVSGGSDRVYGGSGAISIVGNSVSSDTVFGGAGSTYFQAGGGNSYIVAGSGETQILAGSGNLVVSSMGSCSVTIEDLPGAARSIAIIGSTVIDLAGYGTNPIISESLTQSVLTIKLGDGTNIIMSDLANEFGSVSQGILTFSGMALSGPGNAQIVAGVNGNILEVSGPSLTLSGTIDENFGSIEVAQNSVLTIDNLTNQNGIDEITIFGNVIDVQTNLSLADIQLAGGNMLIDPATVITNDIRGTGSVNIETGTSLLITGSVDSGVTLDFGQSAGTIDIATLAGMSGVIAGFSENNVIDFSELGQLSETYQTGANGLGTLVVSNGVSTVGHLQFENPSLSSSSFVINNLGAGIEQIAVSCFVEGTPIRSLGIDKPVECLKIGDLVDTHDGRSVVIRWIGKRRISGTISFDDFPISFPQGSLGDGLPTCDMGISSDHALFVGGVLIPAGLLCNKVIRRIDPGESVTFYHVECERHEVILAAGVPVESFVDIHSRDGFDNSDEYRALYGSRLAPPITECAPRVVAGEEACSAILNEFGYQHFDIDELQDHCELRGHIDEATLTHVTGWAVASSSPALVEVSVNNRIKGYVQACNFRKDLCDANIGGGYAAFRFEFAQRLPDSVSQTVSVRIVGSKYLLSGSPKRVTPADETNLNSDPISVLAVAEALAATTRSSLAARSGDNRPIALVLDENEPDPNRDAGSEAILCYARTLRDIGYRVLFAVTHGIRSRESIRAIQAGGGEVVQAAGCTAVEAVLSNFIIDLVLLHRPIVAVSYAGLVRARAPNCKIVMAVADLEHIRFEALWHAVGHKYYRDQQAIARRRLDQAVHLVDQVFTHSLSEKRWLRAHYPMKTIDMLLWTPSVRKADIPFNHRTGAGFIGSMGHAPNLDALYWIDREIEPKLRAKNAKFVVNIIGSQFHEDLYLRERDGMHFAGLAQDLAEPLSNLRITVAPLRTGAGVKGKVLSSLCAGVPCVMTSVAADGLDLPTDLMALVADDTDGIVSRMIYAHEDQSFHDRISKISADWAEANLGTLEIRRQMEASLFGAHPELNYVPRNLEFASPQSGGQRIHA